VTELVASCDGGSRGNPGQAAFGYSIVTPDGEEIDAHGETIGIATNNVAEYTAVLRALGRCAELGAKRVHVRSDSQLLIRQLTGLYKIKHPNIRPLAIAVHDAARAFEQVTYEHVPRAENARADELVNLALDGAL
jgi:ribonuclease HI